MCNRFAMFPAHLLRAGLSHREQSVMLCLLSYRNSDGQAWPSRSKIAADTGLRISHVHESVRSLAGKGFIMRETQPGVRTVYTFPCLDAQPAETPAPAPVVAKNATAAAPASVAKPAPAPAPEPVREPVPVATPEPAPEQPTADNPSHVAAPVQQPVVVAPAPVATPAPQSAPAPAPALEPAPPPKREITSARVARLPDVGEAVRREVDAHSVVKSSGEKEVDPELMERAKRLQKLCAENTARSREQKAAAQRFMDGVTAATEQVAKQRAAQDIAAARQRAAQDAAAAKPEQQAAQDAAPPAPVAPVTGQKPERAATEKTTNGQNADAARDSAARDGCYPVGEKTNPPEPVPAETVAQPTPDAPAAPEPALATATPADNLPPVTKTEELPAKHEELKAKTEELAAPVESIAQPAPDTAAPIILPVVVHESPESAPQPALPIICAPQTVAPQQGELLPAPVTAGQGELLPAPAKQKRASRLPDDWRLPRSWGEWAMQEMGMTADAVRWEADKFADYWHAKAGANACKVNWQATWRNWIRKNAEQGGRAPQQKSKMTQALENLSGTKIDWKRPEKWNPFAKMTDKERADAQAREDAKRNKERE